MTVAFDLTIVVLPPIPSEVIDLSTINVAPDGTAVTDANIVDASNV